MKFDFAIGNPPYQDDNTGGNKEFASPVYNLFLDSAYDIAEKVEMIHPARFLFNAGSTPKAWNEKMLKDKHFKVLEYENDATQVFSNTDIKGGIAITYHSAKDDFGAIEFFSPYKEINTILEKTNSKKTGSLSDIIYTQNKFNLENLYSQYPNYMDLIGSGGKDRRFRNNIFDYINAFTDSKTSIDDISVLGVVKNKRCWKYIDKKFVDLDHENLTSYKTILPRANGKGGIGDVFSTPLVLKPFEGYTQTFIGIGSFDNQAEAENVLKYIKTKYVRTMLGTLKITQDNDRQTWRNVPLQDFSSNSDIVWSASVKNIDRQLYKKYGLSQEEIDFIESNVKEME